MVIDVTSKNVSEEITHFVNDFKVFTIYAAQLTRNGETNILDRLSDIFKYAQFEREKPLEVRCYGVKPSSINQACVIHFLSYTWE